MGDMYRRAVPQGLTTLVAGRSVSRRPGARARDVPLSGSVPWRPYAKEGGSSVFSIEFRLRRLEEAIGRCVSFFTEIQRTNANQRLSFSKVQYFFNCKILFSFFFNQVVKRTRSEKEIRLMEHILETAVQGDPASVCADPRRWRSTAEDGPI